MTLGNTQRFKNVCPRNCPSSCTMISVVENNQLVHITGDPTHPYTKGKLCAKAFLDIERNNHPERLKYPYYQANKGSGKFKRISWTEAYEIILNELKHIRNQHDSFLPVALYKGSGNIGLQHFVTEQFFSSIGETTKIESSSFLYTNLDEISNRFGIEMLDPSRITDSSLVIIWGSNPASTNIHLMPILIDAKIKGAKIVVVDPLNNQTAQFADLFLQIRPGTDGALAHILLKDFITSRVPIERNNDFLKNVENINIDEYVNLCDVDPAGVEMLKEWFSKEKKISIIIGNGLLKHSNSLKNLHAIYTLVQAHKRIRNAEGNIFYKDNDPMLFNNQSHSKNRLVKFQELYNETLQPPIEFLWITCANPLIQEPNTKLIYKLVKNIPFVITVDQFMTPTAKMSNLVLPATSYFEEWDIVKSSWHKKISLNERAIAPFYESKSDWSIMNELATQFVQHFPDSCSFPIHSSEEEYLNAQFNENVSKRYSINSILDLQRKITNNQPEMNFSFNHFPIETVKDSFPIEEVLYDDFNSLPTFLDGKLPNKTYPYWLITSHHPHGFNSQFFPSNTEAYVEINPQEAKTLKISNGDLVRVYNDQGSIEIMAVVSSHVPKDILQIYQGWYPSSQVNINHLVSFLPTDLGNDEASSESLAFYDTFVNIEKL